MAYLYSMRPYEAIIYGAYGYTGKLITEECKAKAMNVLLAGRDRAKLQTLSDATDLPFEVCNINDSSGLSSLLRKAKIVIHCAGPFQPTAKQMIEACLVAGTHYLDITGEFTVFEMLAGYDSRAKEMGILVMPGVGFDVVPSDCLALHLKKRLPTATHLELSFTMSKGGASRGTARTMVEGMGYGSMIRKDGRLTPVNLGAKTAEIDFGAFRKKAICIPWGDISTAWRSTGIPNIQVYFGVTHSAVLMAKLSRWLNWLVRKRWVKDYLRKKVDARPAGPDDDKLYKGRTYLWGRVRDDKGNSVEARMKTINGYLLTARMAVIIAGKLLHADVRPGYHTPAQYFGEELVFEIEGTEWVP